MNTRLLLTCGVIAGPLNLAVYAVQALTRDGYDPVRHPMSLLALGDGGWVQVANFVVTGALYVACALGLRRVLRSGPGRTWGPVLVGVFGLGLIISGVFPTDAGAGFPAGAPAGAPELSRHGVAHEVGFGLANLGVLAACLVFARRFAGLRQRGWAAVCVATPVVVLVLVAWPDLESLSLRLVTATAVLYAFLAALAARERRASWPVAAGGDLEAGGTARADLVPGAEDRVDAAGPVPARLVDGQAGG